ncbi:MAG: hypothetical protein A2W74_09985 [Planctomycetes bacterium RIFCSPLOWO2_12_38_17]|nr:MAG: hypothetical protein A2W74_09985 [Planctomycetes bacterium RIFCSPLOWO2_12_38_17]
MKKIIIQPAHTDARGIITDLLQDETINAVTIISFKRGAVRANHYHKKTFQWNYIMSGRMKLVTCIPGKEIRETIMEKGDFAVTEPHEQHALVGLEQSEVLVLTKGPRGGTEYESDTYRLVKPLVKPN